ncbi:MAG: hypothetical protein EBQ84_13375 [Betaproteobacteria bacterium]|nr:hypothetical protein [Betaproteobacteria bacterium]
MAVAGFLEITFLAGTTGFLTEEVFAFAAGFFATATGFLATGFLTLAAAVFLAEPEGFFIVFDLDGAFK